MDLDLVTQFVAVAETLTFFEGPLLTSRPQG
jgi:hypothetical protein